MLLLLLALRSQSLFGPADVCVDSRVLTSEFADSLPPKPLRSESLFVAADVFPDSLSAGVVRAATLPPEEAPASESCLAELLPLLSGLQTAAEIMLLLLLLEVLPTLLLSLPATAEYRPLLRLMEP